MTHIMLMTFSLDTSLWKILDEPISVLDIPCQKQLRFNEDIILIISCR